MSLYATLWKLKFPRHGDYHRGCDGITVTAQACRLPTPGHLKQLFEDLASNEVDVEQRGTA